MGGAPTGSGPGLVRSTIWGDLTGVTDLSLYKYFVTINHHHSTSPTGILFVYLEKYFSVYTDKRGEAPKGKMKDMVNATMAHGYGFITWLVAYDPLLVV